MGTTLHRHDNKLLLDAPEAARRLGIGTRTLWRLTKCKAVPSLRIGRRVLYSPSALAAWIDAGAPEAPGAALRLAEGGDR
jgi:excisionase family DNA binding protein